MLAIITVIVGFIAGIVLLARRAGGRFDTKLAYWAPGLQPPVAEHIQERVRQLYEERRKVEAIRLIRQETGLGLKEAKDVAEAIAARRYVPTPRDGESNGDLADRVRALKAAGREEQAVYLVRGETGMTQEQAEAFVSLI